jgi:hypothetical protein
MSVRPCKKCDVKIAFARTSTGKMIPLDMRAPVYRIVEGDGEMQAERVDDCFVTHFATCPAATSFSKGGRR